MKRFKNSRTVLKGDEQLLVNLQVLGHGKKEIQECLRCAGRLGEARCGCLSVMVVLASICATAKVNIEVIIVKTVEIGIGAVIIDVFRGVNVAIYFLRTADTRAGS